MKISLLHPSRGRVSKAFETAKDWINRAGCPVEYILSIDKSDVYSNAYAEKFGFGCDDWGLRLGEHKTLTGYICRHEDNQSVVEATNHAAEIATGDILLYLSDDFKCFDNWGVAVLKEFENESRPLLLKVDDCLQKFEVPVLTIPIMNRKLYERLGYFWNPEYKSMFVDEHLYWVSRKLGAMKMCPHLKFPHEHPSNGKAIDDETYRRSAANWEQGKAVFARHKAMGFPI